MRWLFKVLNSFFKKNGCFLEKIQEKCQIVKRSNESFTVMLPTGQVVEVQLLSNTKATVRVNGISKIIYFPKENAEEFCKKLQKEIVDANLDCISNLITFEEKIEEIVKMRVNLLQSSHYYVEFSVSLRKNLEILSKQAQTFVKNKIKFFCS